MQRYVSLNKENNTINQISDKEFDGSIMVFVDPNKESTFIHSPFLCWVEQVNGSNILHIPEDSPRPSYEQQIKDFKDTISTLQSNYNQLQSNDDEHTKQLLQSENAAKDLQDKLNTALDSNKQSEKDKMALSMQVSQMQSMVGQLTAQVSQLMGQLSEKDKELNDKDNSEKNRKVEGDNSDVKKQDSEQTDKGEAQNSNSNNESHVDVNSNSSSQNPQVKPDTIQAQGK